MNGIAFSPVGLLAQGFTILVAVSVLLGRIYFLNYFEILGIPTSDVQMGVVDYSVISPEVTILGFGIASLYMGSFWFILNSTLFQSSRHWNWTRILLGLLLLAIGLAVSQFIARPLTESEDIQAFNSGVYALATLIYIAISVVAGAMVVSGMPSRMSEGKDSRELHNALRMMLPIVIVILGVFITLSAISFTTTVARLDARNTLADAPHARIQFNSSSPEALPWHGSDECLPDYASCDFRVVLTGDRFIYLSRINEDVSEEDRHLYAFPTATVKSITYILE